MSMMIAGATLAKHFSSAFGRMILSQLLKGEIDPGDVAEELNPTFDFIPNWINRYISDDYLIQQDTHRFLTKTADQVAVSMQKVYELEGQELTLERQTAVTSAVAHTLHHHAYHLLLDKNLNADHFRTALLRIPCPDTNLDPAELEFYKRVLTQCTHRMFQVAAQFPTFQRDSFAHLMQNVGQLQDDLQTVIRQLNTIYETSLRHNPDKKAANFEQKYRTLLTNQLDNLHLWGIPQTAGVRKQRLSATYTRLQAMAYRHTNEPEREHHQRTMTAHEGLTLANRLLVVAPAGAGKTTLLKWLAVRTATQDINQHDEKLHQWHGRVPFFVRLRDFSQEPLPASIELPTQKSGVPLLKGQVPDLWLEEQLQNRALILLDGLDEVTEAKRQEAMTWLNNLILLYPHTIFVVTSRPAVLDDTRLQEWQTLGFFPLQLQRMDDHTVQTFINQWYTALVDEEQAEKSLPQLQQLAQKLLQDIDRSPALRELATTPLLCALLCALHLNGKLPRNRLELYQDCLTMFLDRRDNERGIKNDLDLELSQKLTLLGRLAYWMMSNNSPVIHQADAERELSQTGLAGAKVLRFLVERSGLLQAQSQEEFDFVHRTFQEYLAAKHIVYHNQMGFLLSQASKPEWAETMRLTAGLGTLEQQTKLLETITRQATTHPDEKETHRLGLLAWECLSRIPFPPTTLINLIKPIAQNLLVEKEGVISLSLAGQFEISNLTPLQHLTQLQRLNLNTTGVIDLSPLQSLSYLQKLYLNNTGVTDLSSLQHLVQLQRLDLNNTGVTDLSPLQHLVQLHWLDFPNTKIVNLTPLQKLSLLRELDLRNTKVTDITPLQNLRELQILRLSNTDIKDLAPLQLLSGLQRLDLDNTEIINLTPLQNLSNLQQLYLMNTTGIVDITPLQNLFYLRELDLDNTLITDITPLHNLSKLQCLDIRNTEITDISSLQYLRRLQILILNNTLVISLEPLKQCTNLQVLDVQNTPVQDFTPLLEVPSLKAIWVSDPALLPPALVEEVGVNPDQTISQYWYELQQVRQTPPAVEEPQ